jgi:membrane protease YdiL (CAAX protease family)
MEQVDWQALAAQPLWKRIVRFPLVAMLIAIAIYILSFGAVVAIGQATLKSLSKLDRGLIIDVAGMVAMVLAYKFAISRLGEIKRDDLRADGAVRQSAIGLGYGAGLFSFVVAVAAVLGVYRIVGPGDFSDLGPALIAAGLFPAISEEMLFRGILFRWIEEFGGSWTALILTSALFGAGHLTNPHASGIAAFGIAMEAGLMLGAAYMLTRSLWLPMGIHAAWNLAQGEVFDIPVSGTAVHGVVDARLQGAPLLTGNGFGLEASLIAIVIATAFGVWMLIRAIRAGQLMSPWWVRRRLAREAEVSVPATAEA